jgi:protein TonB
MFTDVLPQQQLLTFLMAPPPPPPPPPAASVAAAKVVKVVESDILNGRLRAPSKIPQNVQMIREDEAPPDLSGGGVPGGVPGGIPGGQLGGVIGGILSSTPNAAAVPKLVAPVPTKRIRVSQGVTEGRLIQKIEPTYPPLARSARIQGQVVLAAIISKSGEIQNLVLVSGHPLLVPATLEAVKKWRYRPYLLNGEPVEVETTITVNFELSY